MDLAGKKSPKNKNFIFRIFNFHITQKKILDTLRALLSRTRRPVFFFGRFFTHLTAHVLLGAWYGPQKCWPAEKIWWVPKIEIWAPKIEIWDRKSNGMLDLSACNSVMEMNRIRLYFWYWGLKSRFFLACGAIFFACGALLDSHFDGSPTKLPSSTVMLFATTQCRRLQQRNLHHVDWLVTHTFKSRNFMIIPRCFSPVIL